MQPQAQTSDFFDQLRTAETLLKQDEAAAEKLIEDSIVNLFNDHD